MEYGKIECSEPCYTKKSKCPLKTLLSRLWPRRGWHILHRTARGPCRAFERVRSWPSFQYPSPFERRQRHRPAASRLLLFSCPSVTRGFTSGNNRAVAWFIPVSRSGLKVQRKIPKKNQNFVQLRNADLLGFFVSSTAQVSQLGFAANFPWRDGRGGRASSRGRTWR